MAFLFHVHLWLIRLRKLIPVFQMHGTSITNFAVSAERYVPPFSIREAVVPLGLRYGRLIWLTLICPGFCRPLGLCKRTL